MKFGDKVKRAVRRTTQGGMHKAPNGNERSTGKGPDGQDVATTWKRSADREKMRDLSHWRGHGRYEDVERWERIGRRTVELLDTYAKRTERGPLDQDDIVLEWGPGGGSNVSRVGQRCKQVYGVDVSEPNLDECERVAKEVDGLEFHPVLLSGTVEPEQIVPRVPDTITVFVSTAVFQHFPDRDYGRRVLQTVRQVMQPGGLGLVQIRYDDGTEKYRPKEELGDYQRNFLTATSYQLPVFWDMLVDAGFGSVNITSVNTEVNYATFQFTS